MSTPPPFSVAPRKSKVGLWVGLILGGAGCCFLLLLGVVGGGAWFGLKKGMPVAMCIASLSVIRDSLFDYAREHGGKLPPAASWQTAVRPYYKKNIDSQSAKGDSPFQLMSADGVWTCDREAKTGIAYNSDVAGKKIDKFNEGNDPVIVFEVAKPAMNAAQKYVVPKKGTGPIMFMDKRREWFSISALDQFQSGTTQGTIHVSE